MDDLEARQALVNELAQCSLDPAWFLDRWGRIYDSESKQWIDFRLWPAQREALALIHKEQLVTILKARQLGLTWLCLGYALWQMLFHPVAKVLVFSRREEDAIYLLGDERLRGMYRQLPSWLAKSMRGGSATSAARSWGLENESTAHCFPINAGDSYTATFALCDEFDLLGSTDTAKEQQRLLQGVQPTIDAGGKLVLLSRSNKQQSESTFKKLYLSAKADVGPWKKIFLPWYIRPGRDAAWYERQKADSLAKTGFLDGLYESYPATDAEALAPAAADKRIPADWLLGCFQERKPLARKELPKGTPAIPGLEVYVLPEVFHEYVIGGDPAQGNPSSDFSALTILDLNTGEEVAALVERIQPMVFAEYVEQLGQWYNRASALIEINNHGHLVVAYLQEHSSLTLLCGLNGKPGWLTNMQSKAQMYNSVCDALSEGTTPIHSFTTYAQLCSIEGRSLEAPDGLFDDRAIAYALACQARIQDSAWYVPGCLTS